ncbi:MAG TPA: TlpA disulfide reductase family protein [Nocardioides sp.]|uniref:TlpA family protein disulfide reductase n=1 Tax=Nocardioides sp. TaxID=35761 RepID=UPI002BE5C862|nr:TlpA disulfide reductase family protein [Nocardioides sp.]HQR26563.1 TlpA disulfide reductase family protein [Nocardioides sp.]
MARPVLRALAAVLTLLLTTAACSSLEGTGDKGYISGNGQITVVDPGERGEPVELEGTTLDGEPLSLADLRGSVVVVNVWWSACGPCRSEEPKLVAAHGQAEDAEFVGVNIRDSSVEPAQSFVRRFDVPYPSIFDPSGKALLAFAGTLSPRTIPSTVLLDRQGRIAASVIGEIPSTLTLTDLVAQIADEPADG